MKKWESPILIETGQVILAADMDNDCIPELIVRKFTTDPNLPRDTFKIAFLDSRNGHLKKEFVCAPYFIANSSMTVVDIDNDGIKEIIFARSPGSSPPFGSDGTLVCYDYIGNLKWTSNETYYYNNFDPGDQA